MLSPPSLCERLPLPSSGLIGGSGTCGNASLCNPNTSLACGSSLDCVGTDLKHYGQWEAFAAGEAVGKGYKCGGSIGVSCISGLTCSGMPTGVVGGTGTCE